MESVFVIWLLTCVIGSSVHYLYERLNGMDHIGATKVFNRVATASGLAGLVGGIITCVLCLLLILLDELLGVIDIWVFYDLLGKQGLGVFLFSNIAVSAAYLGYKGDIG